MRGWKGILHGAIRKSEELVAEIAGVQWATLGGFEAPGSKRQASSLVDLEALLLIGEYFDDAVPDLGEMGDWWQGVGSHLTNRQRMQNLRKHFPDSMSGGRSARLHLRAGTDLVEAVDRSRFRLDLMRPALLQLRLRAGFGVNARADILAYLMGRCGETVALRELASASGYARTSVLSSLGCMEASGFVRRNGRYPSTYTTFLDAWKELLGPAAFHHTATMTFPRYLPLKTKYAMAPRWRPWGHLFSFLAQVRFLSRRALANPSARRSFPGQLHSLFNRLRDNSWQTGLQLIPSNRILGERIADALPEIIGDLRGWSCEHV